jgi:nucleoid DNA-binding protein
MRKQELARRLARCSGVSPAEAADELDRVVHGILRGLRKGESVPLPGLGKFKPGRKWELEFEAEVKKGRATRG